MDKIYKKITNIYIKSFSNNDILQINYNENAKFYENSK